LVDAKGLPHSQARLEWNDDDFDVLADGEVVGRIMKANAAPGRKPAAMDSCLWPSRGPHAHSRLCGNPRGCDGRVCQELAAAIIATRTKRRRASRQWRRSIEIERVHTLRNRRTAPKKPARISWLRRSARTILPARTDRSASFAAASPSGSRQGNILACWKVAYRCSSVIEDSIATTTQTMKARTPIMPQSQRRKVF
jgi:predicted nucleic acid-binding Zn ribbon protein